MNHPNGALIILILLTVFILASCDSTEVVPVTTEPPAVTATNPATVTASVTPSPIGTATPSTAPENRETAVARLRRTRTAQAEEGYDPESAVKTAWQESRRLTSTMLAMTPSPTLTPSQTRTPSLTPPLKPTIETIPINNLVNNTGPWFVYYSGIDHSIYVSDPDLKGQKYLLKERKDLFYPWLYGSPNNHVAFVTEWDDLPNTYPQKIALIILSIPDGNIKEIIPLITHPDIPNDEVYLDSLRTVIMYYSLSWSPDGRYLAFIGAIEGSTADLYVYDTKSGAITRLTAGGNRAAYPIWSPDGNWIVHLELDLYDDLCDVEAIWAVSVQTGEINHLFDEGCSFTILAWTSPESFISVSHRNGLSANLRSTSIKTGDSVLLLPKDMAIIDHPAVAANPKSGTTAFSVHSYGTTADIFGTYVTSAQIDEPILVTQDYFWHIYWMAGINQYIGYPDDECGVILFMESGDKKCFHENEAAFITKTDERKLLFDVQHISVSPDGETLFISATSGAYLFDKNLESKEILINGVEKLAIPSLIEFSWQPDSKGFVIHSCDNGVYYVNVENSTATLLVNLSEPWSSGSWLSNSYDYLLAANDRLYYYNRELEKPILITQDISSFSYTWVGTP